MNSKMWWEDEIEQKKGQEINKWRGRGEGKKERKKGKQWQKRQKYKKFGFIFLWVL